MWVLKELQRTDKKRIEIGGGRNDAAMDTKIHQSN
jgi:hypothetical protein